MTRDERRQFDRSRLIVDVYFDGGEATGAASTRDLSMGGIYLSTKANIPVGSTLILRIPVCDQRGVLKGDIVYSNRGQVVGVRFHRLSEDARAVMERELMV